jgi:iron complex transport system ATP-binding protein
VFGEDQLAPVFEVDATVDSDSPTGPHIAPHRARDD